MRIDPPDYQPRQRVVVYRKDTWSPGKVVEVVWVYQAKDQGWWRYAVQLDTNKRVLATVPFIKNNRSK